MNETLTVFMISEIERLREEGREPARRIYHNMLRTLRESAGKEEIGFEEVTPVFLGKYEHWLLGKRLSWNTVSTYMRALRAGYNRGMKGRPGYVTGLFRQGIHRYALRREACRGCPHGGAYDPHVGVSG